MTNKECSKMIPSRKIMSAFYKSTEYDSCLKILSSFLILIMLRIQIQIKFSILESINLNLELEFQELKNYFQFKVSKSLIELIKIFFKSTT